MNSLGYVSVDNLIEFANNHVAGIDANDIARFPKADVENVRHGEWLYVCGNCKEELWVCDQCGRCIRSERMEKDKLIKCYPYCHCGAKMDIDNEERK